MATVIELLDRFNRKERFFLLAQALGNPKLTPDPAFLGEVGEALHLELPPPEEIHCFMDFHLDWIYASLVLSSTSGDGPFPSPNIVAPGSTDPGLNINTNQEDVDLLLAFEGTDKTTLVMIEAKATTSWTLRQLGSKAHRLRQIFGETGQKHENVEPHFILMAPRPSLGVNASLDADGTIVPQWMLRDGSFVWLPLHMPTDRIVIVRCDGGGTPSATGTYWRVKPSTSGHI